MSARWPLMPDVIHAPYWHDKLETDYCRTCGEDWPCLPWRQAQAPKCKCSHLRHKGQCYSAACGCAVYRPEPQQ